MSGRKYKIKIPLPGFLDIIRIYYYLSCMLAKTSTFSFDNKVLHYIRYGEGSKVVLAFHGFGQTGTAFQSFASALGSDYSVYSFDLPFHGQSDWKSTEEPLSKSAWRNLVQAFLVEQVIDHFSLAGFSLGGKLALATLEAFPARIKTVMLLAPDGIKTNFWYNLATYPSMLRNYFKSLILKPKSYFYFLSLIERLHLMDKGILKLASSQMQTVKKRRRVYYTWVVLRHLFFDPKTLALLINKHGVDVTFYLGEYDKVITRNNLQSFLDQLDHYDLHELRSGHFTLIENAAKYIRAAGKNLKNLE